MALGFSTVYNYKTCLEGFLKIWIFGHQPRLTESKSFEAGNLYIYIFLHESQMNPMMRQIQQTLLKYQTKKICVFNYSSTLRANDEDIDPYTKQ